MNVSKVKRSTTLVVMAAGIGSRFGGGIKQLEPVGPCGEIIMDYSIYDALEAGFNKIVFIIRKDLDKDFREIIGNRIEKICPVEYVYQEIDDLPQGYERPVNRVKPWGTGQAILTCKDIVKEPFVVINADDYYGKEAFVKVHEFLVSEHTESSDYIQNYCMAGFILKNTLSDNGGVTRGICHVNEKNHLLNVVETHNIVKTETGAAIEEDGKYRELNMNSYVSMNMWGLTPGFFEELETGFVKFLSNMKEGDIKSEYLLPTIIDGMLTKKKARVTLLETNDKWFGVTYKEDKDSVVQSFKKLIAEGMYKEKLF